MNCCKSCPSSSGSTTRRAMLAKLRSVSIPNKPRRYVQACSLVFRVLVLKHGRKRDQKSLSRFPRSPTAWLDNPQRQGSNTSELTILSVLSTTVPHSSCFVSQD